MMQKLSTFWASTPPDPSMSFDLWRGFREEIFGWLLGSVVVGAALIIGLYVWQSRRLTIRSPQDPFLRYVPLRWLWLAIVPGVVLWIVYAARYAAVFPEAAISSTGGAAGVALNATLATYVIAQVAVWLPGVTPRKFLYHPRWPWRLFATR